MQQEYIEKTLELMDFISDSPSCFHAIDSASQLLIGEGFTELKEDQAYNLKKGKNYFVKRNSSSLIAFRIPQSEPVAYRMINSHSDSPCLKVKHNPEMSSGLYTTLNVEVYGGMLLAPWFDRPLSIAGRAYVNGKEVLVNIDKDLCLIPNLCIHHNREVNKGHEYNVQKELLPLICTGDNKGLINELLSEELKCKVSDIEDFDLYLYVRDQAKIWGFDNQFFSAPKIDDLMCAFTSLKALFNSESTDKIQLVGIFDNEEVGSMSRQGAESDFLIQTVTRISEALKLTYDKQCQMQASSLILSADNAHSFHPNYPEACDPVNKPVMNGGIVIKYSGNMKYTTDAKSGSALVSILKKAKVPYQIYHNNSNIVGGSTLGNISQTQISIPTVDIGAAQLAMHSPYETAGTEDCVNLINGMTAFFNS